MKTEPTETTVECQDCGWTGPASHLNEIRDLGQRVASGEPMPAGECPECGALAHETETTVEHTPGPWLKMHFADEAQPIITNAEGDIRIAEIVYGTEKDARLIALAPEMAEALQFALDELADMTSEEFSLAADKPIRDRFVSLLTRLRGE